MPNLFIDIEARFAKFQDSLDRAKKQTDGFVSGISRSFASLGNIAGPLAGVASLAGLVAGIKSAADAADELDKVSQKTGVTTEALSELKFAAEINNVTFDQLQDGFKKLAVAIDANDDVFRRLGLDPKSFKGLDDALSQVADRFSQIQDPASAAALAVDLFGKSGNELIPLLRLGKAGIQEFREEANRLGLTITADFAKSADSFNDNIERLSASLTGLGIAIANKTIGPLNDFIERVLKIKQISGSFFGDFKLEEIGDPFRSTVESIKLTETAIKNARSELAKLKQDLAEPGKVAQGTPRLAAQSQVRDLEKSIETGRQRLELLKFDREKELQKDPLEQLRRGAFNATEPDDPGFIPGSKVPDKAGGKTGTGGVSDFESLKRSLTSQLQTELKLTEELILVEDKRFKALKPAQQGELRALAQRVDAIKLEKVQQETVRQSIEFEQSLREVSEREELASIDAKKSAILRDYQDRKLSAQEYYSFLAAEETKANEIQIRNLKIQEEIATSRVDDTSLTPRDRDDALLRQAEVRQRINSLILEQTDIEQRNARAAAQADEEALDRKVQIAQQLNALRGTPDIELDRLALERQFKDLPEEFKASVIFQTFLDTTIAEQQLVEFERKAGTIQQTLQVTEERNQIDFDSGTINRQEFRERTVSARREAIDELTQQVAKIEEIKRANEASFGPEQEVRLVTLKNRLKELSESADVYLNTAKEIGSGPTTQFFEDIISGSKDASSAFDDLVKSIQANLARLLAEDITNQLFGSLRKGTESFGGIDGILKSVGGALGISGGSDKKTPSIGGQSSDQGGAAAVGVLEKIGSFFGFGGTKPPQADLRTDSSGFGLSTSIASQAFGIATQQQGEGSDALPAFTESLTEGAASLLQFNSSTEQADSGVENLGSAFSSVDVGAQLFSLLTSSTQAVVGTEALASATTSAAAQIAIAGATASASSFSADGNIFSGGYQVAFAKGGAFDGGDVMPFAVGGIVSKPTTFPIRGGKTGLMGEAGPEAIMPLSSIGGKFSVYAIGEDGKETTLPIARGASGKLSVQLPDMGSSSTVNSAFAFGGVFAGGVESTSFAFADGAVFTTTQAMPLQMYEYGGVANRPQVAVFGEGSRPEAFVPLPDGRTIPVTVEGGASQGVTVIQNISTPDANSFRRSRSALFNDVQAGLSTAVAKS